MEQQRQQEMTERQFQRVRRLIENECCNYVDDICILQDKGYGWFCPQMGTRTLFCPWFKEAVLPLNERLQAELTNRVRGKPCRMCKQSFIPKSNRALFCPRCAVKNKKLKNADRMWKKRHGSALLETVEAAQGADFRTQK